MSEIQSNRRLQAQQDLGLNNEQEQAEIERSMQKELERKRKKEEKRMKIEQSLSYNATKTISKYLDDYCLDPIIGFIPGGFGDFLSSLFVVPFIYVAACKVRSLPLTLAVIFNVLRDIALGLIPFWIGNLIDFANRAFKQNRKLIVGFVEDKQEVIDEVNKKLSGQVFGSLYSVSSFTGLFLWLFNWPLG